MQYFSLIASVLASLVVSRAAVIDPQYIPVDAHAYLSNGTLAKRSGCGSTGPLGEGHYIWYIVTSCNPGVPSICQATDATGCLPGSAHKIGSIEVDDPNDEIQYNVSDDSNSVPFICPAEGQVRCQANFNDNDDGPKYSLRVFQDSD